MLHNSAFNRVALNDTLVNPRSKPTAKTNQDMVLITNNHDARTFISGTTIIIRFWRIPFSLNSGSMVLFCVMQSRQMLPKFNVIFQISLFWVPPYLCTSEQHYSLHNSTSHLCYFSAKQLLPSPCRLEHTLHKIRSCFVLVPIDKTVVDDDISCELYIFYSMLRVNSDVRRHQEN
jgi:hypothetical protein